MKKIFLLLLITFSFSGCEKDDICDANTATTPRLIIEFYDNALAIPTLKNVTNLGIISPSQPSGFKFSSISKIQVPLKTDGTTVTYNFVQNGSDTDITNDNTDVLTFNYTTYDVFVSRACGYKTLFNLNPTSAVVATEPTIPDGTWIKNIEIVKPNLESENEVHIKIKF